MKNPGVLNRTGNESFFFGTFFVQSKIISHHCGQLSYQENQALETNDNMNIEGKDWLALLRNNSSTSLNINNVLVHHAAPDQIDLGNKCYTSLWK
jgi:hypothetical protein